MPQFLHPKHKIIFSIVNKNMLIIASYNNLKSYFADPPCPQFQWVGREVKMLLREWHKELVW